METRPFQLVSDYQPAGDQPQAIEKLVEGLTNGLAHQTLLGVTGSGKTYTIANVIASGAAPDAGAGAQQDPGGAALRGVPRVLSAATRWSTSSPTTTTTSRKPTCPRPTPTSRRTPRSTSTSSRCACRPPRRCWSASDSIIVATVSSHLRPGRPAGLPGHGAAPGARRPHRPAPPAAPAGGDAVHAQRARPHARAPIRVRGDVIDIFPAESRARGGARRALRRHDRDRSSLLRPADRARSTRKVPRFTVYPGTHYVTPRDRLVGAVDQIREDLRQRLSVAARGRQAGRGAAPRAAHAVRHGDDQGGRLLRRASRTIRATSPGANPASRRRACSTTCRRTRCWSSMRATRPIPQLGAMYKGDRSRKEMLVEYGFRLPSALDNRPLKFEEWEQLAPQMIFVSATPGPLRVRALRRRWSSSWCVRPG